MSTGNNIISVGLCNPGAATGGKTSRAAKLPDTAESFSNWRIDRSKASRWVVTEVGKIVGAIPPTACTWPSYKTNQVIITQGRERRIPAGRLHQLVLVSGVGESAPTSRESINPGKVVDRIKDMDEKTSSNIETLPSMSCHA